MANVKAFFFIGVFILLSVLYTTEANPYKVYVLVITTNDDLQCCCFFLSKIPKDSIIEPKTCSMNGEKCDVLPCCPHPTDDRVCYNYNKTCGPLL